MTKEILFRELTDRQKEVYAAYKNFDGSDLKVAASLEISIVAVRKHLFLIAKKGYTIDPERLREQKHYIAPDRHCEQAPAGFGLDKSTIQSNSKGEIVQRWDKVSPLEQNMTLFVKYLSDRTPPSPLVILPPSEKEIQKDIAFVWPCVDLHIGLFARKLETLDSNFNLDISKKLEDAANQEMFKKVGPVDRIHLAFLGDTTHIDNKSNMTPKNGNVLDVSGTYSQIVWACQDIICNKIDQALNYAKIVSVDIAPGNHDPNTSVCMLAVIAAYYRNEPRVKINTSPAPFRFFHWGVSFLMGAHGDEAPAPRLAAFLMDYVIQNEIRAKELYAYQAHVHHRKAGLIPGITETDGGVLIETFPTLTAKDNWHTSKAYLGRRATIGKIFHKKHGLIDDCKINAKFLSSKYDI